MPLSDEQLQDLEAYLDGALTPVEAERVRARLAAADEWGDALTALRAERVTRQVVFTSLEPTDEVAERLSRSVIAASRRQRQTARLWRWARVGMSAAACTGIGLLAGWTLRDRAIALNHGNPDASKSLVASTGEHPNAKVAQVVSYQVELTDEAGRVTAVQSFDSLDKAREFADDLSRWQERQRQMRNGTAVVVADKF